MHRGYIKIYRKIGDSGLFQLHSALAMFVYMLTEAAHKPTRYGTVDLDRGQLVTGRNKLSSELGLSEQKVRTCLDHLHDMNMITSKSTNKYTVYTIVNYSIYQDNQPIDNQQNNQQITNKQPTDNQQITTIQEAKHLSIKEDKPIVTSKLVDDCPHKEIIALYHETLPSLPSVKLWTTKRATALKARWREDVKRQNLEWWGRYFKFVGTIPFLLGQSDRGWIADIDFLLRQDKMLKIIEGGYENGKQ